MEHSLNWTEVLLALGVRFLGVYIVLIFIMICIYIMSLVFKRSVSSSHLRSEALDTGDRSLETIKNILPSSDDKLLKPNIISSGIPGEVAVAIGLALYQFKEEQRGPRTLKTVKKNNDTGVQIKSWKIIGRQEALQGWYRWMARLKKGIR